MKSLILLSLIVLSLSSNASQIKSILKKKGFTNAGAAGIMGNLYAESGLNPRVYETAHHKRIGLSNEEYVRKTNNGSYKNFVNDRAGFGLAQWTFHSRKQALLNMCRGKIGDLSCQLNYLTQELKGYGKLNSLLRSTNNVNDACDRFLLDFERPAGAKGQINKRRSYCRKYL